MRLPLQITAKNLDMTDAIDSAVRKKAEKLEKFSDQIMACRVVVECPHRHQQKGTLYNVHIDLTVPGHEIVVKREPNEDLYVAVRDAFDAAGRQLKEHLSRKRNNHNQSQNQPDRAAG